MMFWTHIMFAFLLVFSFSEYFNNNLFILLVLFFSILPDIDCYNSKIGRKNRIISYLINIFFKHRGIFHSFIPIMILFFLFYVSNEKMIAFALLLGYSSHLILDAITVQGIMPFYPLTKKKIRGFIKLNGFFEKIILVALISFALYKIIALI